MKLQPALGKTAFKCISEALRLLFTDAVAESIIGETLEGDIRQGNRIWISQELIAGREGDFGGLGQNGDVENRYFEGHVRAN
jgi:hypothetical protein